MRRQGGGDLDKGLVFEACAEPGEKMLGRVACLERHCVAHYSTDCVKYSALSTPLNPLEKNGHLGLCPWTLEDVGKVVHQVHCHLPAGVLHTLEYVVVEAFHSLLLHGFWDSWEFRCLETGPRVVGHTT